MQHAFPAQSSFLAHHALQICSFVLTQREQPTFHQENSQVRSRARRTTQTYTYLDLDQCKTPTQAHPRAFQESQSMMKPRELLRALRYTARDQPPLRHESLAIFAPDAKGTIHAMDRYCYSCALGDLQLVDNRTRRSCDWLCQWNEVILKCLHKVFQSIQTTQSKRLGKYHACSFTQRWL